MDETRVSTTEEWVAVTGGELRVRRHRSGRGDPMPVLAVHGAFANGHLWDDVVAALAAAGEPFDLLAVDLPLGAHHRPIGRGVDLTVEQVAGMLIDVVDALGLDRVVAVANDSGGAITQLALTRRPDRFAGVLLTPTETSTNFPPRYFRALFAPLRWRAFMWAACQLLRTSAGRRLPFTFGNLTERALRPDEAQRLMGPLWTSAGARDDLRRVLASVDPAVLADAERRFPDIAVPVDVAWCADHRIFPDTDAATLAASFPNGRRLPDVDGLALTPLDQPADVARQLTALVQRARAHDAAAPAT